MLNDKRNFGPKNDWCILATYPNGNEYVVYDELTYKEANDLLIEMHVNRTEEEVIFVISDGSGKENYI